MATLRMRGQEYIHKFAGEKFWNVATSKPVKTVGQYEEGSPGDSDDI
jgi:hypothetical protein